MLASWLVMALGAPRTLNADAVSYLDIAYSCANGNWHALVNGYWSPGFPFLLALLVKLFKPSPFQEPLLMHLLAFGSLILALAAFEHFLRTFFAFRIAPSGKSEQGERQQIPDDTIRVVGYAVFFWISIFLTPPYLQQPDILVFVLYLLAASLAMQLVSGMNQSWRYVLFGGVLGLGYLVKAVMFPLGFTFIAILFFGRNRRQLLPKILLTAVTFAAVSSPFIFELSKSKGRLTYGDVGAVAYRHIMGFDVESHDGEFVVDSRCTRKPMAAPHIAEYTEKIELGTYPPWADPSYDYKGAPVRFDVKKQLNRMHVVLRDYFELYVVHLGPLVCGFLVLLLSSGGFKAFGGHLAAQYVLWFPALAGLFLYSLLRVEDRMLAGFTIALFAAGAAALRIANTDQALRLTRSVGWAVSIILACQALLGAGHDGIRVFDHNKSPDQEMATALQELGVAGGERVVYIGDALTYHGWAHLARVKIAAEIPEEDVLTFWAADGTERLNALSCVAATGAKALVTRNVPGNSRSMGWRQAGSSDYFVLTLADFERK